MSLDAMLRRDRNVVMTGIAAVTLVAWTYLLRLSRDMGMPDAAGTSIRMVMPRMDTPAVYELLLLFAMWVVMMTAMMVPSAAPLVLLFTRANREQGNDRTLSSAAILLLGYLLVWTGFSVVATLATWALRSAALLSPALASTSPVLGGIVLAAAGVFQFTPLKHACLVRCRSPFSFLLSEWGHGRRATLRLGIRHGAYCVGCCWHLMALLFVAGVMNLLWVAAIALFVLVEKTAPRAELPGRVAGVGLILAGALLIIG